jgi:hypothetical protein
MLVLYRHYSLSWGWFAALFLIPDLAMLGYLAGPRVGRPPTTSPSLKP